MEENGSLISLIVGLLHKLPADDLHAIYILILQMVK